MCEELSERCIGVGSARMLGPRNDRTTLVTPALRPTQVQTFHGDLLQHMEKNTKLDMQFIKVSLAAPPQVPSRSASPHMTDGHTETCPGH